MIGLIKENLVNAKKCNFVISLLSSYHQLLWVIKDVFCQVKKIRSKIREKSFVDARTLDVGWNAIDCKKQTA